MAKTTILDIIDGPMPLAGIRGASPAAKHVAEHVQDPLGATKDGFSNLGEKQLQYEQAKQDMVRQLAPVKSVIQHVETLHGLPQLTPTNNQDPNADPNDPNNPDNIDPETGLPYPPGQNPNLPQGGATPMPGQMNGKQPADTLKNKPGQGPMLQQPNMGKANLAPGRSPMPKESVRPQKLGQDGPGGSSVAGYPKQNTGTTTQTYPDGKPAAAKPKGGLPAKKNPAKKAEAQPARQIKVHVSAGAAPGIVSGAMTIMASKDYAGLSAIDKSIYARSRHPKDCLCAKCSKMNASKKKSKK